VALTACSNACWGAHRLDHRVGPEPAGELLDLGHSLLPALLDDIGGAVEPSQLLPVGVAGHGNDPLGAELAGGQDGHQPDRAVPDDRDHLARAGLGGHGAEPAGAEHIGGGQQRRDQLRAGLTRGGDQGPIRQRDPGPLGLGTDRLGHERSVHTHIDG
jgi:hypothetical protein